MNGNAIYGEATVRNTTSNILRHSHHAFHTDKFFSSICELHRDCRNERDLNLTRPNARLAELVAEENSPGESGDVTSATAISLHNQSKQALIR